MSKGWGVSNVCVADRNTGAPRVLVGAESPGSRTHACRLTREEYLPKYVAHPLISITFHQLAQCPDHWGQVTLLSGNVTIDQDSYWQAKKGMTSCIDITNLVKCLRRSPVPNLVFNNYHFQIFFDGGDNPTWDACLDIRIAKVWAWPEWQGGSGLIYLDVKADHIRDDPLWPRKKEFSLQQG